MLSLKKENSSLKLAANWIMDSGIQSPEGGVYAWYDLKTKSYSFLYSEITGYYITSLLFLSKFFKDVNLLTKAQRAADWIINSAMHQSGGVRTRLYKEVSSEDGFYSFSSDRFFSFDTGMVLFGMVNLYKATKESRYLNASNKIARFLLELIDKKDGSLMPIYDCKLNKPVMSLDKWSNQPGSFHAKVALGFIDMLEVTKEHIYKDAALRICECALSKQEDSGRFITNVSDMTTNLHPHCYSIEGLLYAGASLNKRNFIDSAAKAIEWLFNNLGEDGLYELYDPKGHGFNGFQRTDILAQAIRLGRLFKVESGKTKLLERILLKYQYCGEDKNQSGGFLYSKDYLHTNSWCTMFSLQALALMKMPELAGEDGKLALFV